MGSRHRAFLLLSAAVSCGKIAIAAPPPPPAGSWTPTVGVWNGSDSLPALPQTSRANLPHSPMLGNGYMGVQLATARADPSIVNSSTRGPAAPGSSLHLYIGSNAMWGVYPSLNPALGHNGKGTRRAVGGLSLSGLEALLGRGALNGTGVSFSAEQRITSGELHTTTQSAAGTFTTITRMDPRANVLTLSCTWAPSPLHRATHQQLTAAAAPLNLTLSAWVLSRYPGTPPGQMDGPFKGPVLLPTSSAVFNATTLIATREAVPTAIKSPRRIKVALAVTTQPHTLVGASSAQAVNGPARCDLPPHVHHPCDPDPVAAATGYILLTTGRSKSHSFTVVAAMADNLHSGPTADTASLGVVAAQLAQNAQPAALASSASDWWAKFWARSFVHLPTEPDVEALWNGAQYILACSAAADADAATPAPGLGGPFVTSDNSGWNADYTLDYNYEATFYGVYASGHPELAQLYWAPVLDGIPAARRNAVYLAKSLNLSSCAPTALHYSAHIAPWGYGEFDEDWETKAGNHMMWNGVFGALLFINDLEYLGSSNTEFFKNKTLPLLEGLLDWWACYLVKRPCSPAGTHTCPADGWRYDDANDAVNEGSSTINSQMALAFIARLVDILRTLPTGVSSRSTPIAKDIATHLAPFDTNVCLSPHDQTRNETVWVMSEGDSVADTGMFAMYPVFPSEFLSVATATPAQLATAQATARIACDLSGPPGATLPVLEQHVRPVEVFAATVMSGSGASDMAWSPEDVIAGFKVQIATLFGPNFLTDTGGGGIENVGMSRAVCEMLLSAPSGHWIELFPFWPKETPAQFGGLMAKGGFRLWANYTPTVGVSSPVRLTSIAGTSVVLLNPWPGQNVSVIQVGVAGSSGASPTAAIPSDGERVSSDSVRSVPFVWVQTASGQALKFDTSVGDDNTYIISKVDSKSTVAAVPLDQHDARSNRLNRGGSRDDIACPSFSANCSACMSANDTRKDWASPCVFLSGSAAPWINETCQPIKWWAKSAAKNPHIHVCGSCTQRAGACPAAPPPPPPPEATCPAKQLYRNAGY